MVESYKSINKFLGIYILLSILVCLTINKFNILIPYYVAITFASMIGILSFIINEIYLDITSNIIYKNISYLFAYLGVLKLLLILYNIYQNNVFNITVKSMDNINLLVEAFLFYLIIHTYRMKYNFKKIIYIMTFSIITLYSILMYCNTNHMLQKNILKINLIVLVFGMIIQCINLFDLKKMNKHLDVNTINDLTIIIISKLGIGLVLFTGETFDKNNMEYILFFILIVLNIICSYTVTRLLIRDIIKKPNKNLYDNLIKEKNKFEEILIDIEDKKEEIRKYKNWVEESLMIIPLGIILCEDNKIIFINKQMKSYLNIKNVSEIIGFDYERLIMSRSNKICGNKLLTNNVRLKFKDNEFLGEEINIKDNEKDSILNMIIIQDLNAKIQIEKLKNTLEQNKIIELGRNEMLSNISHEFKTPVNVIYSTAQLLDLEKTQNDYKKLHEYNILIKRNCDRLIRMINNFIDSTKFEANIINMDLKIINIVSLVEDLTMSIINFAQNKNIEVIFDTEEEEIYILADIDFIERIILNVLSNAIKYNSENGSIFVNIIDEENKVIIEIIDTGFGIPGNKLNKLFNRFERFDNNNLSHEEGTGLGLNIVKQMVDALKGDIKVVSKEGEGTTIRIIFDKQSKKEDQITDTYDGMSRRVALELSDI